MAGRERRGTSSDPTYGGRAPRGATPPKRERDAPLHPNRHDPKVARRAARLDDDLDPSTIDDEPTRAAYLERLESHSRASEPGATKDERAAARAWQDLGGDTSTSSRRGVGRVLGSSGKPMDSAAGVFLGMIAAALTINYLRNGTAGLGEWWRAKFLNEPTGGNAAHVKAATPAQPAAPDATAPAQRTAAAS